MFIITSQWNGKKFDEITCNLDPNSDPNYGAYVTGDSNNVWVHPPSKNITDQHSNLKYFKY